MIGGRALVAYVALSVAFLSAFLSAFLLLTMPAPAPVLALATPVPTRPAPTATPLPDHGFWATIPDQTVAATRPYLLASILAFAADGDTANSRGMMYDNQDESFFLYHQKVWVVSRLSQPDHPDRPRRFDLALVRLEPGEGPVFLRLDDPYRIVQVWVPAGRLVRS